MNAKQSIRQERAKPNGDRRQHRYLCLTLTCAIMPASDIRLVFLVLAAVCLSANASGGQEPSSWGEAPVFHTFSIAAVDPRTGETGVAVTTRVACVGNAVPWVRAGVGAVATQAYTRVEYSR